MLGPGVWQQHSGQVLRRACEAIAGMTRLTALDLSGLDICDAELQALAPILPQLQQLGLGDPASISLISVPVITTVITSSCITSLHIQTPEEDQDSLAAWLGTFGCQLHCLSVSNAAASLARCPCRSAEGSGAKRRRLRFGRLVRRDVTAAALSEDLAGALSGPPALDSLSLTYFELEGDAVLQLARCSSSLTSLQLLQCEIDKYDACELLQSLTGLRHLQLSPLVTLPSNCHSSWGLEDLRPQQLERDAEPPAATPAAQSMQGAAAAVIARGVIL
ncbi:hypothetical protein OEZ86_004389 [Tetradesmus obliquus]|nr:hypothetical protein OEZ86_004389 [Tetradesmus obliquus]